MRSKLLFSLAVSLAPLCAPAPAQVEANSLLIGYGNSPATTGGVEVIDHDGNQNSITGLSSYIQDVLFVVPEPWTGNFVVYANGFPYPTRVTLNGLAQASISRLVSMTAYGTPTGFVVGRTLGEFFFADAGGIHTFSSGSTLVSQVAALSAPRGLALHGDTLYTVQTGAGGLEELVAVDANTGAVTPQPGTSGLLTGYLGRLAAEPNGDIALLMDIGITRYMVASAGVIPLPINPPFVPSSQIDIAAHSTRAELAVISSSGLPAGELSRVYPFLRDISPLGLPSAVSSVAYMTTPRGAASAYGQGCPGSGSFMPLLSSAGAPVLGGSFTIQVSQGLGGASALLFLGLSDRFLGPLPVLPLDLGPLGFSGCRLMQSGEVVLQVPLGGAGAGNGAFALPFTIPMMPQLVGAASYLQTVVMDPGGAGGIASTGLLEVVFG